MDDDEGENTHEWLAAHSSTWCIRCMKKVYYNAAVSQVLDGTGSSLCAIDTNGDAITHEQEPTIDSQASYLLYMERIRDENGGFDC